jgi:hypothetical protein
MITSLFFVALSSEQVPWLVFLMFDKSPPTERPNSVPAPYYSENPRPVVGIYVFFDLIFF